MGPPFSRPGPPSPCSAAAWDTVEELSAAASHAKDIAAKKDPLEEYCESAPDGACAAGDAPSLPCSDPA